MPPETLAGWLDAGRRVALYDVRTREEYRVSHLPGAVRVDPDAGSLPPVPAGAEVVVTYCSLGFRSSALAARAPDPEAAPPRRDLDGGIFAWAHEALPLVDAAGRRTRRVHPFGGLWRLWLPPGVAAPGA